MKHQIVLLTTLMLSLLTGQSDAQVPAKAVVGVTPVKVSDSIKRTANADGSGEHLQMIVESLDNQLASALQNSGKFDVVTRQNLDAVQAEQNLGPMTAEAVEAFQLKGASVIAQMSIDSFQDQKRSMVTSGGRNLSERAVSFGVVLELIDTKTGRLLNSSNRIFIARAGDADQIAGEVRERGDATQAAIRGAATEAATFGLLEVLDREFPARVVLVTNTVITINRGESTGIVPGQYWNIFEVGEVMVDPDTGESLGQAEVLAGTCQIISVMSKVSRAEVLGDASAVEKLQILRLATEPPQADDRPIRP